MKIVERKIDDLIGAEYNPRELTDKQYKDLKDSLKRFGIVDPVIVNKHPERMDIIIGGHQRSKVWKDLGNDTISTVEVELTPEKEKELNVRLNKNTGQFDMDALANYFEQDDLIEWGFDEGELVGFDDVVEMEESEEGENIEVPTEPKTVLGDLYELNGHRVHCASSTEIDAVEKLMNGKEFDCVVTDPPYNVAYEGKTKDAMTIQNDSMGDSDFYQFLYDFYTAFGSFTKKGGAWYVWFADVELVNFSKAFVDSELKLSQVLIWKKQSLVMGRKDYHFIHEPCLYGWKEGASHNWYSDRKQTTVLEFQRPSRNDIHPTMKPVPLIKYQIENSSKKGDLIGDGFLGSGSTLIASEESQRICYGQELDPKYCDVIVKRWVKFMKENGQPFTVKRNGEDITKQDWLYE